MVGREPLLRALVLFQGLGSPEAGEVRARLQASDRDETIRVNATVGGRTVSSAPAADELTRETPR